MKDKLINRKIKLRGFFGFTLTFIIAVCSVYFINKTQEKEEKMKARYTAESTVNRIESKLNTYLVESELIKNTIESGKIVDMDQFATISSLMQDEKRVIEAHELAKDGIVNAIYPLTGNEEALGLNMLKNPERRVEATLAKESGEYTIAGPYELVQGGTGALLFEPIYTSNVSDEKEFWGFSILVINWEKFIEEMELDKLEEAGYHYIIWKKNMSTNDKAIIAQCQNKEKIPKDALEVACSVPNDTWYVEIVPEEGWVSNVQKLSGLLIAVILSALLTAGYCEFEVRRRKDYIHALELEKSAKEAQKANEAKTRFLFNMSHDIRTPMNAIIGFSNLLEEHIEEKEKATEYIAKIKSSSSFLLSLINYVLEMARIESGKAELKTEVGCIRELTESLNAVFAPEVKKKNLSYRCEMDVEHEYVICDRTKVREILLNIVSNSVKYTPEGGKITCSIKELPMTGEKANYEVIVEDSGIGMSKEYLPHIFEEFTREHTSTEIKVTGTGLGLPIVKSLIDLMGGTIQVDSELGKGTRTTIVLPFKLAEKDQIQTNQEERTSKLLEKFKGKRILLAEDNELNAEIAVTVLEEKGMKVHRVQDGVMCVAALQNRPEDYYDLILMDIQMPNMDGYQTTEMIRNLPNKRARIPIVAMTANAFEEDKKKAMEAGMDGHIAKPIDVDVLFKTLLDILS